MSGPRILAWDLENGPGLGWFYGSTWQTNILKVKEPSRVLSFAASWVDEKAVEYRSDFHDGHDAMIARIFELLDEADAAVTWNGRGHDTPHINTEFLRLGLGTPSPYKEIDLYQVVKRKMKFHSNKLDYVAQELGIGKKLKTEGIDFWLACMDGDAKSWAKFKAYNVEDVKLTKQAYYDLLAFIPRAMHPNANLYVDDDLPACPKCGSDELVRRGKAPTMTAFFPRYFCTSCKGWSQGKKALESVDVRGVAA